MDDTANCTRLATTSAGKLSSLADYVERMMVKRDLEKAGLIALASECMERRRRREHLNTPTPTPTRQRTVSIQLHEGKLVMTEDNHDFNKFGKFGKLDTLFDGRLVIP